MPLRGATQEDEVLCMALQFTVILRRPRSGHLEGRANTRPSLSASPLFRPYRFEAGPSGHAFAAKVLGSEDLRDLHRIQRRALAQAVGHDPESEAVRLGALAAHPAHIDRVLPRRFGRGDIAF